MLVSTTDQSAWGQGNSSTVNFWFSPAKKIPRPTQSGFNPLYFVNIYKKVVENEVGAPDMAFEFTISFDNAAGILGEVGKLGEDDSLKWETINISGNKAEFKLRPEDEATFHEIPSGVTFTVTEKDYPEFKTEHMIERTPKSTSNLTASAKIVDTSLIVEFTNTFPAVPTPTPTPTPTPGQRPPGGGQSTDQDKEDGEDGEDGDNGGTDGNGGGDGEDGGPNGGQDGGQDGGQSGQGGGQDGGQRPHVPGGRDPNVPPAPSNPSSTLVPGEDGRFIEIGEDGVPLGEWYWDNGDELWIFDEYPPKSTMPKTGAESAAELFFVLMLVSVIGMEATYIAIRRSEASGE